ncbi:MAG: cyclic nucleotide-binding domain-containing protein [Micromonosporaceae bacterium]
MGSVPAVTLNELPRFRDLTEDDKREITRAGQQVTVPDGWSLVWEKTPADKAYLIIDGRVAVHSGGRTIAELGPGDLVGELALAERRLRTATASALTSLRLLHFTGEAFADLYQRVPGFRDAVDATVAERTAAYSDGH